MSSTKRKRDSSRKPGKRRLERWKSSKHVRSKRQKKRNDENLE